METFREPAPFTKTFKITNYLMTDVIMLHCHFNCYDKLIDLSLQKN